MKKSLFKILLAICCLIPFGVNAAPDLPRIEILGGEYYCYEVKRGDSLYGIAKALGWDLNVLETLNPTTVKNLKKGAKLYYPVDNNADDQQSEGSIDISSMTVEPISHKVKKGETVYSIARLYKVPVDEIYKANPESKYKIRTDEILIIPQSESNVKVGNYIYYKIKSGDTLYGVSKQFHTTVSDLLSSNPGVSEQNFRAGDNIRIPVLSNVDNTKTEIVEREQLSSVKNYKVQKNESWETVAKKTGVSKEQLRLANENVNELKKDEVLAIPVVETVEVSQEIQIEDPRERTREGVTEIYDSIHGLSATDNILREVKLALLIDDPNAKLDTEFTRGLLLAIDDLKNSDYKIHLKVIDGRRSSQDVTDELDEFEPTLIFTTANKAFPAFLADYGETNNIEIINVFDVKNELYQDNPGIVQLLPPSNYFNDEVVEYLQNKFGSRMLIIAGDKEENDQMITTLLENWKQPVVEFSLEELDAFDFSDSDNYLVYACSSKKEDAMQIVSAVAKGRMGSPLADISIIGRPNWITMTSQNKEKFYQGDVYIPTRFYFDPDERESKKFVDRFTEQFGHSPVKSFPMYAVMGYDVTKYFIPATVKNGGDFNRGLPKAKMLQSDFNLKRVSNWGGFINPSCYMLRFTPLDTVEKINLTDSNILF